MMRELTSTVVSHITFFISTRLSAVVQDQQPNVN